MTPHTGMLALAYGKVKVVGGPGSPGNILAILRRGPDAFGRG
jgi:hypothetical protein